MVSTSRLAAELRTARDGLGRSLRTIAEQADISAAYLQKLETGRVATPSPKILERLAATLGLDYGRLMAAAGFTPVPESKPKAAGLDAKLAAADLTETEERAVVAFIETLVAQRTPSDSRRPPRL